MAEFSPHSSGWSDALSPTLALAEQEDDFALLFAKDAASPLQNRQTAPEAAAPPESSGCTVGAIFEARPDEPASTADGATEGAGGAEPPVAEGAERGDRPDDGFGGGVRTPDGLRSPGPTDSESPGGQPSEDPFEGGLACNCVAAQLLKAIMEANDGHLPPQFFDLMQKGSAHLTDRTHFYDSSFQVARRIRRVAPRHDLSLPEGSSEPPSGQEASQSPSKKARSDKGTLGDGGVVYNSPSHPWNKPSGSSASNAQSTAIYDRKAVESRYPHIPYDFVTYNSPKHPWNKPDKPTRAIHSPSAPEAVPESGRFCKLWNKGWNCDSEPVEKIAYNTRSHPWNRPDGSSASSARSEASDIDTTAPYFPRQPGPWNQPDSGPVYDPKSWPWNLPSMGGPSPAPRADASQNEESSLKLELLGTVGTILKELGMKSELDLAFFAQTQSQFKEEVCNLAQKDGRYLAADFEESLAKAEEAWNLAKVAAPRLIDERAKLMAQKRVDLNRRPESGSMPTGQPAAKALPTALPSERRAFQELMVETRARPSEKDRLKPQYAFILGVFLEAGRKGRKWLDTKSDEQADANERLLLKSLEPFKDDFGNKITEWKKWRDWCSARSTPEDPIDPFLPAPIWVVLYLDHRSSAGKTAASGARGALDWWMRNVGIEIPTEHERVLLFKTPEPGHVVKEAVAVPPWIVMNLHRIAVRAEGAIAQMATFMLMIIGACLRGRHFQRSRLIGSTDNALIFECIRGKTKKKGVRPPFQFPVPRKWVGDRDIFDGVPQFYDDLIEKRRKQGLADYASEPFLVPTLVVPSPKEGDRPAICTNSQWGTTPMSDYQYRKIIRAMFMLAGAPEDFAKSLTVKSCRKFMPSGGENLFLPSEMRNAIGNWVDAPKASTADVQTLPSQMSQLYSAAKLPRAFLAKKWVIAAVVALSDEILSKVGRKPGEDHMPSHSLIWENVASSKLTTPGNYEQLAKLVPVEEGRMGDPTCLATVAGSVTIDMNEPFVILAGDVGSPSSATASSGVAAAVDPQLPQERTTPEEGASKAPEEDSSSSSDSEEEAVEDPKRPEVPSALSPEAHFELESEMWFVQEGVKVAHLFEIEDKRGRCIPKCRSKAFPNMEDRKDVGFQCMLDFGLRMCVRCSKKLSPEALSHVSIMRKV